MVDKVGVFLGFVAGVILIKNWPRFLAWFSPALLNRHQASGEAEAEAVVAIAGNAEAVRRLGTPESS